MSMLTSNPLTSIPGNVRVWLYWTGYVLGVISQGVTILWGTVAAASPDISMPTWLVIVSAVVAFAQTQLNLLAGSNVSGGGVLLEATVEQTGPDTADVTVHAPDESGSVAIELQVIAACGLVALVALFLF